MSSRLVWYRLLGADGKPYKGIISGQLNVCEEYVPNYGHNHISPAGVQNAVKTKHSNKLSYVDAADLLIYKNKASFDRKEGSLNNSSLSSFGKTESQALIVVVSSNPYQKQRLVKLCDVLEENIEKSNAKDSQAYAYLTWDQVESVFSPKGFTQLRRAIDDAHLDLLASYLSHTAKCFGDNTTGQDAKRSHFIAPLLICVCSLFNGDAEVILRKDLVGESINARSHYEFMLRRGNKAICVVEAKKGDLGAATGQALICRELAAEIEGLDTVYAIATNYVQWNFLRVHDDKTEMEECFFHLTSQAPDRNSLKNVAEKIYAMLSDE